MNLSQTLTAAAVAAICLAVPTASLSPAHAGTDTPSTVSKQQYGVTATTKQTEVVQGDDVVVKGVVTKATRGQVVVLQVKYDGGTWKKTDITDRLDGQSRFRLVDTVGSSRSRSYRVLAPAGKKVRAGHSTALPVVVYAWRDLISFNPVRAESTDEVGTAKINGVSYPATILAAAGARTGGTDYNLDYKCTQLETQAGLEDTSSSDATGVVSLKANGTERFRGSYALAQSEAVTLPLTGVFRLTFDWEVTSPTTSRSLPALGSPRVLCKD